MYVCSVKQQEWSFLQPSHQLFSILLRLSIPCGNLIIVKEIFKEFKDSLEIVACQIGYIEPGHGLKGKQRWLSDEEDIEAMYASFKARREIVMWCLPASDSSVNKKIYSNEKENKGNLGPPPQKKSAVAQKINEVEDIISERAKRASKLTYHAQ